MFGIKPFELKSDLFFGGVEKEQGSFRRSLAAGSGSMRVETITSQFEFQPKTKTVHRAILDSTPAASTSEENRFVPSQKKSIAIAAAKTTARPDCLTPALKRRKVSVKHSLSNESKTNYPADFAPLVPVEVVPEAVEVLVPVDPPEDVVPLEDPDPFPVPDPAPVVPDPVPVPPVEGPETPDPVETVWVTWREKKSTTSQGVSMKERRRTTH